MFRFPPKIPLGFDLGSQIILEWLTVWYMFHFRFWKITRFRTFLHVGPFNVNQLFVIYFGCMTQLWSRNLTTVWVNQWTVHSWYPSDVIAGLHTGLPTCLCCWRLLLLWDTSPAGLGIEEVRFTWAKPRWLGWKIHLTGPRNPDRQSTSSSTQRTEVL